jgi:Sugar (and other) transporter
LKAVIPISTINFLGTILAILLVDYMGRRSILLTTLPFCGFFMAGLGGGILIKSLGLSKKKNLN